MVTVVGDVVELLLAMLGVGRHPGNDLDTSGQKKSLNCAHKAGEYPY
jgi:hypothetical protein